MQTTVMPKKTPIVLFTYKRPMHTSRVLESLSKCHRLNECQLYVYCGSSKSAADESAVNETRKVVTDWQPKLDAVVIMQETNTGCARTIVDGVSEACNKYGRVIVIEDDLVLDPDFINYMLMGLDKYQDEKNVYQIAGFMYPVDKNDLPDTFFLPFMSSWGWATWDRAWKTFTWDTGECLNKLADRRTRKQFDLDNSIAFYPMLEGTIEGRTDAWDILWYYNIFCLGGLILYPRRSFVWNGGFDGTGANCGSQLLYQPDYDGFVRNRLSGPVTFPDRVEVNNYAFTRVKRYLRVVHASKPRRFLNNILSRIGLLRV